MRLAFLLAALAIVPGAALAQEPFAAPPYQRMRTGADRWRARNGSYTRVSYGYGGFFDPYVVAPPIVAGTWYQRPYPYHFDYYRYRWGGAAFEDQAIMNCPSATAINGAPAALRTEHSVLGA
jgi:hypothetical protein